MTVEVGVSVDWTDGHIAIAHRWSLDTGVIFHVGSKGKS